MREQAQKSVHAAGSTNHLLAVELGTEHLGMHVHLRRCEISGQLEAISHRWSAGSADAQVTIEVARRTAAGRAVLIVCLEADQPVDIDDLRPSQDAA